MQNKGFFIMYTSPFQLLNFENCNLSLGKSKIVADDKTYELNWNLQDNGNFYSENELGQWQLSIKRLYLVLSPNAFSALSAID